jgi:hypothetical protein
VMRRLILGMNGLIGDLARLALDYDTMVATQGGVRRFHPGRVISSGNDTIRGDRGEDFVVGDDGVIMSSGTPGIEGSAPGAVSEYQTLLDVEHLVRDVTGVVAQAERSVRSVLGQQPSIVFHEQRGGTDRIDLNAKALVFGDVDPDVVIPGNAVLANGVALTSPEMLAAAVSEIEEASEGSTTTTIVHGVDLAGQTPTQAEIEAAIAARTCEVTSGIDEVDSDALDALGPQTFLNTLPGLLDNEDPSS